MTKPQRRSYWLKKNGSVKPISEKESQDLWVLDKRHKGKSHQILRVYPNGDLYIMEGGNYIHISGKQMETIRQLERNLIA